MSECKTCPTYDSEKHYCSTFCKVIKDTIDDIRANAIDEYKIALHNKYKENKAFAYSVWEGNIYKYDAMANLDLEEIDEIAEQLKGKKNDKTEQNT